MTATTTPTIGVAEARGGRGAEVRLEQLWKAYGEVIAVRDVSLTISPGEFITLLGPSGSGKTTTLMMIAGFVPPSHGEIYIDGRPVAKLPPQKRDLGMVFQNYALFPHMTVEQNIAFPLEMRRVPRAEARARVARALEMVQLPGYERRYPRQLSGGQQQRVALARAVVFEPRVLLMDEPLGALDKKLRQHMQLELKHIQQRLNVTVVYVTHDQEEALTMSDRVAVMRDGRIEQVGTPGELYEEPVSAFVADFIGESNFLAGRAADGATGGGAEVEVETAEGRRFRARMPAPAVDAAILVRPGDAVIASVRPERIALAPASAAAAANGRNAWTGRVVETIYVGDATKYRVAVGETVLTVKAQQGAAGPRPAVGDEVAVIWDAAHTRLLRGDDGGLPPPFGEPRDG